MKRYYDVVVRIPKFITQSVNGIEITYEGETYIERDQYKVEPITLLVHTVGESFDRAEKIALNTVQEHLGLSDEKMEKVDIVLATDISKAKVILNTTIDVRQN